MLRDYQEKLIYDLAKKAFNGNKKLVAQMPTGGGKTFTFAGITHRYLQRNNKKVLILVHRGELLKQTRRTLYDGYGLIGEAVTADVKHLSSSDIYVGMIETAYNRLKKNPKYFGEIGLLILDEVHVGNFRKIHAFFPDTLIIGFTATPVSASKKMPLKNEYDEICCSIDIPDLIAEGALMPNRTYHVKNLNRKELKIKNGEFDETYMADMMSKPKHLHNCVHGYETYARGLKTVVFNCNVEHSKLVTAAFIEKGYNARHLDGSTPQHLRDETLKWFKETPGAIINNIGVLTAGWDEPSIECVVVNHSTLSLPKWLQETGRGSRPFPNKKAFLIIDLGGNALSHGDWCARRDWEDMFQNPDKPSDGGGVAPVKVCDSCEAIIHASLKVCPFCEADVSRIINYDSERVEFELLTSTAPLELDVPVLITTNSNKKDYFTLHQIKNKLISQARYQWSLKKLTDVQATEMHKIYQDAVKTWCHAKGKKYNQWHRETTAKWLSEEMERVFKYQEKLMEVA